MGHLGTSTSTSDNFNFSVHFGATQHDRRICVVAYSNSVSVYCMHFLEFLLSDLNYFI